MFPCEYVFLVNKKKYSKKHRNSWSFAFQRTSVTYAYSTKARFDQSTIRTDRRYVRFIERYFVSNKREKEREREREREKKERIFSSCHTWSRDISSIIYYAIPLYVALVHRHKDVSPFIKSAIVNIERISEYTWHTKI